MEYLIGLYIKHINNRYSPKRVSKLGKELACAEWLLSCAANIRLKNDVLFCSSYKAIRAKAKNSNNPIIIEEVDASDSSVSEKGFKYFAGAPELKAIKFYFCSWLTDAPISTLVKHCGSSLERVEIVGCGHITKNGIYPLEKCKNLKRLHLEYLPKISGLERQLMLDSLNLAIGHHCKITYPFHTRTGMMFKVPTSDGIIK